MTHKKALAKQERNRLKVEGDKIKYIDLELECKQFVAF